MVVIPEITPRMFYIIIAVIGVIGLIVALIQIRRIRKGNNSVKFLVQETEQRKKYLVKMDMESKGKFSKLGLARKSKPPEKIKPSTMVEEPLFPISVREKLESLESTEEYQKVREMLMDIDSKKIDFEKKEKKFEINEAEYKRRLSKFNGGK
jgi:hypothetical protein